MTTYDPATKKLEYSPYSATQPRPAPIKHATTVIDAPDGGFCPYCLTCGPLMETAPFGIAQIAAEVHAKHHAPTPDFEGLGGFLVG